MKTGTDASRLIIDFSGGTEMASKIFSENPYIKVESIRENQIIITGVNDDEYADRLIVDLINRGVIVSGFHREERSLERIFMDMTGGAA